MDDTAEIRVLASHQDQVVACPPNARTTRDSMFIPYPGLDHGDAISFQCHPEFGLSFGTALIEHRRDKFGALAGSAIAPYCDPNDYPRVREGIGRFLDAPAGAFLAGSLVMPNSALNWASYSQVADLLHCC